MAKNRKLETALRELPGIPKTKKSGKIRGKMNNLLRCSFQLFLGMI